MRQIFDYDVYIFDCDGVVFDSNKLKIAAMTDSLGNLDFDIHDIERCTSYFSNNFGKSRFHHINHFVENILPSKKGEAKNLYEIILLNYTKSCKALYLKAEITDGFLSFLNKLTGKFYIASGSEQNELREVFLLRNLSHRFTEILGSPINKCELVCGIKTIHPSNSIVMFGDALSDLNASISNNIDFIAYTPYSNVAEELVKEASKENFKIINHWNQL